jgi:3-isopropylmalate dehydrogenase
LKGEFPKVKVELVRVDTFSSSLPRDYRKYRLVATTNLFGDIASDQASGLAGGVAVAPSLNAGTDQAMAQAVHGTAPDIAGQNVANPTALALSTAMLLRWFDQKTPDQRCRDTASFIERGIHGAMEAGMLTRDLGGRTSTSDFTRSVVKAIQG